MKPKGLLVILVVCSWVLSACQSAQTPPVATVAPSTNTPVPTNTSEPTSTPEPSPVPILTLLSQKDGMILMYVTEGKFTMGSTSTIHDSGFSDAAPVHVVYLDAYWIDQTEVTNEMYAKCVDEGKCTAPSDTIKFSNLSYAKHPVVNVDWYQATAYCSWAERRLPTEAEWEKAARSTDGRTYPWGEGIDCTIANYFGKDNENSDCVGDTTPVGSYQSGKSPYGVYDMAGNAWEWVSSLYRPYPYDANDGREDLSSYDSRVLRGGSWFHGGFSVRSASRGMGGSSFAFTDVGFRCASSIP